MAVETIATTKRGKRANARCTVMKLVQAVYIAGADPLGDDRLSITSRNFPKPFVGASTAATSPPTLFWSPNPDCHAGTVMEAAANAAPIICTEICDGRASEVDRDKTRQGESRVRTRMRGILLTLERRKPKYA